MGLKKLGISTAVYVSFSGQLPTFFENYAFTFRTIFTGKSGTFYKTTNLLSHSTMRAMWVEGFLGFVLIWLWFCNINFSCMSCIEAHYSNIS